MSGTLRFGPTVVKLGGEVVGSEAIRSLAPDLVELSRRAGGLVIVHGGGPQASALQTRLGLTPTKVAGRRVTDAETLDVMKMALAGKVSVDLCSALIAAGGRPVGLNGSSSCAVKAEKRPPKKYPGHDEPVDLGHVGDVIGVETELFEALLKEKFTPVLASLGASASGAIFNINADVVGARVATLLHARDLFMVSDVAGVLRDVSDPTSRIGRITKAEGTTLIEEGVVRDGMIPKLEESFDAIDAGCPPIHILGKLGPGDLIRELETPGSVGTVLVA